jgi:hypothetical protein
MKKLAALLLLSGMFAVVSCGPSAAELQKKKTQDSLDSIKSHKSTEDSLINAVGGLINAPVDTSKKKDTTKH